MDSPVPNRRSRKIAPVGQNDDEVITEAELHNIEDERNRSRKQAENIFLNNSPTEKRLSVSEKSVSEHFHSCIQLAAENKINSKNAFNFKLIDLLHNMLSKKKPIKDFTEVSSSLDAGVKIYSCRVDNVHSDTLKMATSICSNKSKKAASSDGNDSDGGSGEEVHRQTDNKGLRKKKCYRKTKKTTLAISSDQISKTKMNQQNGFARNFLSNSKLIITSALFESSKVCWHLDMSSNFWNKQPAAAVPARATINDIVHIDLPILAENTFISRTFKNFQFCGITDSVGIFDSTKASSSSACDFNVDSQWQSQSQTQNSVLYGHGEDETAPPYDDDGDDMLDHPSSCAHHCEEPRTQLECLSKMMSSSDFVADVSKLITSETSDYRYFNFHLLQKNWTSSKMKHWNPLKKRKENEERKSRSEQKELINFQDAYDDLKILEKNSKVVCVITSVTPREKFLITPVTHFNISEFFRLKVWRDMFIIPSANSSEEAPSDMEDMINDYNYDNPNDSQHFIAQQYEDDYCDDGDDENAPTDVHEAIERNAFMGDNLLEIPNKVCKIQLPYMVKDKSVNMKNLKLKIWNRIESLKGQINTTRRDGEILFSGICDTILQDNRSAKEELSVPILFNAILQLANDKNLYFAKDIKKDHVDFIIAASS